MALSKSADGWTILYWCCASMRSVSTKHVLADSSVQIALQEARTTRTKLVNSLYIVTVSFAFDI